ncbi:unnamed protein product [Caretta caretta]
MHPAVPPADAEVSRGAGRNGEIGAFVNFPCILATWQLPGNIPSSEILRGKDRAWLQSPDQQHALLAISYLGKFQPHLSKEQEAETINTCIAGTMVQRPALAKLRGTEVAESSAMRVECLQQLPWKALDLMLQPFLELHLTPTMLLRLFLHLQPWICSPRAQERSRAVRASARFLMFYRFQAITEDLRPMAEQGYKARLLTSQAFDAQEATRHWASQALYWIFTPCKAVVYTQTAAVATMLSKMQKDASCRESPAHVPMLIAKHLPSRDLMPFSFTLPVGLLEKGERADQRAGVMEVVLREKESELQGQGAGSARGSFLHTVPTPRGGRLSEGTRHPTPTGQTAHQGRDPIQAKAIWRFLGADPMLARAVLHILLYDNPEKGQANAKQTQDRSCPQPAWLPPATTSGLWELVRALGQVDTWRDSRTTCSRLTSSPSPAPRPGTSQEPSRTCPVTPVPTAWLCTPWHGCCTSGAVSSCGANGPGARLAAAGGGPALGLLFSSRAMVIHPKQALKSIPRLLLPNLQASQEGERMACTALFAEFLGSPLLMENEPKAMQKQVVRAMLHNLVPGQGQEEMRPDPGELCPCHVQMLQPCAVLDTMEGLCWMLWKPKVPLKGHVAVPAGKNENSGLRQTSMELFGHLSKFVSKKSSLFRAEVEKSMGMLLIHLQEPPGDPVDTWWTTETREEKAWNACPANPAWHTPGSRVADPP